MRAMLQLTVFNAALSSWDVSRVRDMGYMFNGVSVFNQVLCWNSTGVDTTNMFTGSLGRFSSIPYPQCLLTSRPTMKPTTRRSMKPSDKPTTRPSVIPTQRPSYRPTSRPSVRPSIRIRVMESDLYGLPSPNASVIQEICPDKSKIVEVNGRVGTWIHALYATCDDSSSTKLGPFGNASLGVPQAPLRKCVGGYGGWNVKVGSYIGQLTLNCTDMLGSVSDPIGAGLESGSRPMGKSLSANQRIVGLRTYHNSSGIQAMTVLYADMSTYSNHDQGNGMLSFLYGILAFSVPATIAVCIMFYLQRRRHKLEFRALDRILPLK
jgi:hypothetical protein